MLNKLLKKCMPWMDKGRWYHVMITMDQASNVSVKYDVPMFSRYEIDSTDPNSLVKVYFSDPSIKASIIDVKTAVHVNDPIIRPYVFLSKNTYLYKDADESGYYIATYPYRGGDLDMWLFIKTS